MSNHHSLYSPSSIPALLSCPCFESRGDGDRDSGAGTEVHAVAAQLALGIPVIREETTLDADLFEATEETVEKALRFIGDNCPGAKIEVEERVELRDNRGAIITFGTRDVGTRNDAEKFVLVLDWKACLDFEPDTKDHREQLDIYALCDMRATGYEKALCVEAFVSVRKLRQYWRTYAECVATMEAAIAARTQVNPEPRCNDYCKWCRKILFCPAVNRRFAVVEKLFAELPRPEKVMNPEKATPEEMSVLLTFARATAKKYEAAVKAVCERIEAAAMAMSESNQEIPGYDRVIEAGKKKVTDIDRAFRLSGMKPDEFFQALSCSLPKLAENFAAATGMKKMDARKELEGRLFSVIETGQGKAVLERKGL